MAMAWRDENRRIDFFFYSSSSIQVQYEYTKYTGTNTSREKVSCLFLNARLPLSQPLFLLLLVSLVPFLPIDVNGKKS